MAQQQRTNLMLAAAAGALTASYVWYVLNRSDVASFSLKSLKVRGLTFFRFHVANGSQVAVI